MSNKPFVGQIATIASTYAPRLWALCDGSTLQVSQNEDLFSVIKSTYGGDGINTFALPDLRGRLTVHQGNGFPLGARGGDEQVTLTTDELPSHCHLPTAVFGKNADQVSPRGAGWAFGSESYTKDDYDALMSQNGTIKPAGGGQPHNNMMPFLAINFVIAVEGVLPEPDKDVSNEYFVGEVRMVAFHFAPGGWQLANGQTLPIANNQALFSLAGTAYGGDGTTNFALPNLEGRTPIHRDQQHPVGEADGQSEHILTLDEMPRHTHNTNGNVQSPNPSPSIFPNNAVWGVGQKPHYATPTGSSVLMSDKAISTVGGFVGHQNMQPFQVISFIVRLVTSSPRA
ncbi:MAG TPA: tail fiber protein [Blastocatellia bacterium]